MRTLLIISTLSMFLALSTGCKKPEDKLADHMEEMTEIMEDNEDEPAEGAEELREYMHDNLPDMMAQVGQFLVDIDKEDPDDRADRIKEAKETLEEAFKSFAKASASFEKKAKKDKDFKKYVKGINKEYEKLFEEFGDVGKLMKYL